MKQIKTTFRKVEGTNGFTTMGGDMEGEDIGFEKAEDLIIGNFHSHNLNQDLGGDIITLLSFFEIEDNSHAETLLRTYKEVPIEEIANAVRERDLAILRKRRDDVTLVAKKIKKGNRIINLKIIQDKMILTVGLKSYDTKDFHKFYAEDTPKVNKIKDQIIESLDGVVDLNEIENILISKHGAKKIETRKESIVFSIRLTD